MLSKGTTLLFDLFNRIHLEDPDEDDDEDRCSIVVSLMRVDRKRTPANERPPIGFAVYKVNIRNFLFESNCISLRQAVAFSLH